MTDKEKLITASFAHLKCLYVSRFNEIKVINIIIIL